MMRGLFVAGSIVVGLTGVARADGDEGGGAEPKLVPTKADPAAMPKPVEPPVSYSHKGQVGVSLRLALGLRAIATYDNANYCGGLDSTTTSGYAPVCTSRAPFALDLEVSYGLTRRLDALVEMMFGLESDFRATNTSMVSGPHPVKLSPGARFFYSEGVKTKLFSTAQLVFDFTGYKDVGGGSRGNDIGIRNLNGMTYDFNHDYGVYGYFGETATFARWFDIELELGVGVQGRFGH